MFQVALQRTFNWFEAEDAEWLNLYAEWQSTLCEGGPGEYTFWDREWCYEVTILSPAELNMWDLPDGWEPFANEELVVGWQRNVTMSPERWRPVRRIELPVLNYYQANLQTWAYDLYAEMRNTALRWTQEAQKGQGRGKRKR